MMNVSASPLAVNAPFSQEAEEAVIGAVLINPAVFTTLAAFLNKDDFFLKRHALIWESFDRLNQRGQAIDYLLVSQDLSDHRHLDDIGGQHYLIQIANNTPTSVHAEYYGRLVERASVRRRLLEAADKIKALALDGESTVETVLSEAEAALFSVSNTQGRRQFVSMEEALIAYYEQMEYKLQNQQSAFGVPSGFRDLDYLLGGFQKSDLLIVAGRPGMGKTSWLLTIAMNAARLGSRIGIFTMEMGVEQIIQRMLSMETGINVQKLRLAQMSAAERTRFMEALARLNDFQIFIDDTPALTPMEIRAKALRLKHERGLDMIIIDYMQLMNAGKNYENNRVQEISFISRHLKELARELNIPVLSAAQLSRAVEQRQDKRPVLSDLRESGSIEQDADIVIFLYRDEVYNEATEYPNQADLIVAKHRNGPTGTVSVYFQKELTRFQDAVTQRVDLDS
ncbi:MAG: replicative DNA helicase [Anaerolineae bacterium]|nr:replicative DNA helicase [Anaerolineae bacterium]MDW8171255.1 replicative DNA helicase [Anaerolineae bacterium]